MKNILILFSTIIFVACNSSKTSVENKKAAIKEIVREKAKEVNAKKNDRGYLIGIANKESFMDASYKPWFDSRYSEYNTDKEVIAKLKEQINNYTIKGFMGTWCGDSKRGVPRFYKILEETGFDQDYFELITVGRNKKTPDNLQEGFDLLRVPTFIFMKDGKEVGRFVERPRETMEKDILKIVSGEPYKHSYDKSE
jgi:thiol-disulfide isomerase/thioredoxin